MSNGIVHSRMTKQIALPSSVLLSLIVFPAVGIWGSLLAFISSIIGFVFQNFVNPDSDQFGLVGSEWWLIKKFGIFGWWFVGLFDPYCRWIIPRHRHWLSHGYIIGTLVRLIYLGVIFYTLSFISYPIKWFLLFLWNNYDLLIYFTVAVIIGDIFHSLLDFNIRFREWYEHKIIH